MLTGGCTSARLSLHLPKRHIVEITCRGSNNGDQLCQTEMKTIRPHGRKESSEISIWP